MYFIPKKIGYSGRGWHKRKGGLANADKAGRGGRGGWGNAD